MSAELPETPRPVRAEFLPNLAGDREYERALNLWRLDRYRAALERIAEGPERVGYHDPNYDPQTIAREALAEKE